MRCQSLDASHHSKPHHLQLKDSPDTPQLAYERRILRGIAEKENKGNDNQDDEIHHDIMEAQRGKSFFLTLLWPPTSFIR